MHWVSTLHPRPIKSQSLRVGLGHWDIFSSSLDNRMQSGSPGETHWSPRFICPPSPHSLFSVHTPGLTPSLELANLLPAPGLPFPWLLPLLRLISTLISTYHSVVSQAPPSLQALPYIKGGFHLFSLHSPCSIILHGINHYLIWLLCLLSLLYYNVNSMKEGTVMFLTIVSPNTVGNQKLF